MKKYQNIKEYCDKTGISTEDLKDNILRPVIDFGCRIAHMEDDELQDTENMFTALYFFNDILNVVE